MARNNACAWTHDKMLTSNPQIRPIFTYLAKQSAIQSSDFRWHQFLVHDVQVFELTTRRIALLHQFEHAGHTGALQLRQYRPAFETVVHHFMIRFDTANEVRSLKSWVDVNAQRIKKTKISSRESNFRILRCFSISPSIRSAAYGISSRRW